MSVIASKYLHSVRTDLLTFEFGFSRAALDCSSCVFIYFALAVNLDFPSAISNSYTRAQCGISFIHVYLDVCDSSAHTLTGLVFTSSSAGDGRKLKISYSN